MIDLKLIKSTFSTLVTSECLLSGVQVYEYSVVVVIDHLNIKVYTGLQVLDDHEREVAWLDADKNKRELSGFYACSLVGLKICSLEVMADYKIIMDFDNGNKIVVPVSDGAESYEISGEDTDIYVV